MTFQSEDKDGAEAQQSGSERVGYRSPPKEHRFRKGQSGNPAGRPRRPPNRKAQDPGFGVDRANQCLMSEAYRPVLVKQGERTGELPVIQAVFRAMGVAAMKGDRPAQRMLAELVQSVEAQDRKARDDRFKVAIDYKCNWEEEIQRARELGHPEPQPIPHPDDVFINPRTGELQCCGPMTKEEKAEWDQVLEHLDQLQSEISRCAASFGRSRNEEKKAEALDRWVFEQRLFDKLNDNLPKRYRKSLKDRCWEKMASRPGQYSRHLWLDER